MKIIDSGKLDKKVQVYHKVSYKNELNKTATRDELLKNLWCQFVPLTNSMQNRQADTIIVKSTHKLICRYHSAKMLKNNMHIMFRNRRFNVLYISEPYFVDERIEVFVEEVIE